MNVLLVSEPGENGVFRYVEALAHFLIEQRVRVHLAYSDRRSGDQLPRLVAFIRQNGGTTLNLRTGNRPGLADAWAFWALLRMARKIKPDVIHSHSSKAGLLARALRLFAVTAPQAYQPHAYAGMQPRSRAARTFYNGIERFLGRAVITINVSPDEREYARHQLHLPADRTLCIPNGIDTRHFAPPTTLEKRELRRAWGLPADAPVLGTLGRASPQKDPLTLYRAFAQARDAVPGLVLLHVGSGELDAQIDGFIAGHRLGAVVVRRPFLATPADFYRAVDGFILTSVYEGLSLAVLEALSCGLPLILSEAPGNQTLLRLPLSHIHSAPIGDVELFASRIVRWAADLAFSGRACNHRRLALENFDSRRNFETVLALYCQMATTVEIGRRARAVVEGLERGPTNPGSGPAAQNSKWPAKSRPRPLNNSTTPRV